VGCSHDLANGDTVAHPLDVHDVLIALADDANLRLIGIVILIEVAGLPPDLTVG
jgi:hypothetical protein